MPTETAMSAGVNKKGETISNFATNGVHKELEAYEFVPQQIPAMIDQQQSSYGSTTLSTAVNPYPYSNYYSPYVTYSASQSGVKDSSGTWSNGESLGYMPPASGGYNAVDMYPAASASGMLGSYEYNMMGMNSGFSWTWPTVEGDYNQWGNAYKGYDNGYGFVDEYSTSEGGQAAYENGGGMTTLAEEQNENNHTLMTSLEQGLHGMQLGTGEGGEVEENQQNVIAMNSDIIQYGMDSRGGVGGPQKQAWASVASKPVYSSIGGGEIVYSQPYISRGGYQGSDRRRPTHGRTLWEPNSNNRGGMGSRGGSSAHFEASSSSNAANRPAATMPPRDPRVESLVSSKKYNPRELSVDTKAARYFVIKSFAEDDIHRSIKYGIWCSTEQGNKRLDAAYKERRTGSSGSTGDILLFFSVNGSGHFCGMAKMTSPVDYGSSADVWTQDKWKGKFTVEWIYVKDVPNSQLRHIRLENNENKPVTNSRDTQEIPFEKGRQVLQIVHQYRQATSIFDDYMHYEKQQEILGKKPSNEVEEEK